MSLGVVKPGRGNNLVRVHHCNFSSISLRAGTFATIMRFVKLGRGTIVIIPLFTIVTVILLYDSPGRLAWKAATPPGLSRTVTVFVTSTPWRILPIQWAEPEHSMRLAVNFNVRPGPDSDLAVRLAQAAAGASTAAAAWGRGFGVSDQDSMKFDPGQDCTCTWGLLYSTTVNDQVTVTVTDSEWQSRCQCHDVFESDIA